MVGRFYHLFTSNTTFSVFPVFPTYGNPTKERASRRTIKLNSSIPREFHDESNWYSRFSLEIKLKKERKRENVERTRRSSTWPLGADKPAATRSISRKRDGELYRSIRLPASTRLRIQLPLSAGAIYRETNGRCFFRRTLTPSGYRVVSKGMSLQESLLKVLQIDFALWKHRLSFLDEIYKI